MAQGIVVASNGMDPSYYAVKTDVNDSLTALNKAVDGKLGKTETAANSSKWNGKNLRLNNNTTDAALLIRSGDNVDYITKTQLLSALDNRVQQCEKKIQSFGQTQYILIKTAVSATVNVYDMMHGTVTLATAGSEVSRVTVGGTELLRGSNKSMMIFSAYNSPGQYTEYLYGIFTFNTNGTITVKEDTASSNWGTNYGTVNWNIAYYKTAV